MGTRNLTCVFSKGEYKVAQYGQWDGYPEGQGATALEFLLGGGNIDALKAKLPRCRFVDNEVDKEFIESYDRNAPVWSSDPDNRTPEQKRWWSTYMTRDLGALILESISNSEDGEILLGGNVDFAGSSSCEWAYVIDLDAEIFEIFKGFNEGPSVGRFSDFESDSSYPPVSLVKSYDLNNLPSVDEFVSEIQSICYPEEAD